MSVELGMCSGGGYPFPSQWASQLSTAFTPTCIFIYPKKQLFAKEFCLPPPLPPLETLFWNCLWWFAESAHSQLTPQFQDLPIIYGLALSCVRMCLHPSHSCACAGLREIKPILSSAVSRVSLSSPCMKILTVIRYIPKIYIWIIIIMIVIQSRKYCHNYNASYFDK